MFTKKLETIQWSKPWQLIVAVSLHTKKFLNDFSGMAQSKTIRNTLKFVKVANNAMRVDASSNPPVSCLILL